jgi:hypothetical protein
MAIRKGLVSVERCGTTLKDDEEYEWRSSKSTHNPLAISSIKQHPQ